MTIAKSLKGLVKRYAQEINVHASRARLPRNGPRVVIFPSNDRWDPSSFLRAWLIGPELERLGWRVVTVPPSLDLKQRLRVVRNERPDVILMQQTRHLLNQPAFYAPTPVVLDADDADCLDPRHSERITLCARDAACITGGSRFVARWFRQHNPRCKVIWTCSPQGRNAGLQSPRDRPPIVVWAHGDPFGYPLETELVQEMMVRVGERVPFTFWIFGTTADAADEFLRPIRQTKATCLVTPRLPYTACLDRVSEAAVGIQPVCIEHEFSQGKSFGKILTYLSGKVAVVAADEVDHPLFFRHGQSGFLARTVDDWVNTLELLIRDPELRQRVADEAYTDFCSRLTTPTAARLYDAALRESIAGAGAPDSREFVAAR